MSATISEGALQAELIVSPAEAAKEIRVRHDQILSSARRTVEDAMRIGELLGGVKASLKHGKFGEWIRRNCGFAERCARNYMAVFQNRSAFKSASVSDLRHAYRLLADIRGPSKTLEISEAQTAAPHHAVEIAYGEQPTAKEAQQAIVEILRPQKRVRELYNFGMQYAEMAIAELER